MEINKIYQGDCLELMKQIEDKSVDWVITDAPYGITKAEWDKVPSKEYFDEIFRISKNQILFGGHFMNLPTKDGWIIWNKLPFLKNGNQAELIWTSFLKKNIIIDFRFAGNCVGTKKPNYKREKVFFTSEKPVEFIELLLQRFTKEGDLILDCFAGSGNILVSCKRLNRKYIGIELLKEHFDIAEKRLSKLNSEGKFFSIKEQLEKVKGRVS